MLLGWTALVGAEPPADWDKLFDFVRIPAGKVRVGTTAADKDMILRHWPDADPDTWADEECKIIAIDRPFALLKHEVTQQQYQTVMNDNPSAKVGPQLPVHQVRFGEAVQFCARLSEQTGWSCRLPTEAEWEHAARAGADGLWSCGNDPDELPHYAWFEANSDLKLQPVAQRRPNAWGLYDMHGNAWEWCSDVYKLPIEATYRVPVYVVKGGSAFEPGWMTRSAERDYGPLVRRANLGFRIVKELLPLAQTSEGKAGR